MYSLFWIFQDTDLWVPKNVSSNAWILIFFIIQVF